MSNSQRATPIAWGWFNKLAAIGQGGGVIFNPTTHYVTKHAACHQLSHGFVYFESEAGRRAAANLMTKDEARKLWPNEWLYWHTERHCWDHIKGTSDTYEERQPEPTQQAANVVAAPLPKQVTTTKERSLPQPEIFYPTMLFNKANILEMMPLTMQQPWLSPQSISGWPLLLDVDRPSFREWEKRIGTE